MDADTMGALATVGATGLALYAAHHVGDYWVQTDHQAAHKGDAGPEGAWQCLAHVLTYVATQAVALLLLVAATGLDIGWGIWPALLLSGATHYAADRREHGWMFKLARRIPGKGRFMSLGVPRAGRDDNPSLGTGSWALDQSWHIWLGVYLPALVLGLFARLGW